MKITNADRPGEKTHGIVRGHLGAGRAGSPGSTYRDQYGTVVTSASVFLDGPVLSVNPGNIAVITTEFGRLLMTAVTPEEIDADQDDWDPDPDLTGATIIRASSDAAWSITGMLAPDPVTETLRIIENVGTEDIVLTDDDAGSAAGNRFYGPDGADTTLTPNAAIIVVYDSISAYWRIVGGTGGGTTTAAPYDLNYIIDGGTATITAGIRQVVRIPWDCTVVAARAYADRNGDINVDVLRTTHSDYDMPSTHPVSGDSIIGAGTNIVISSGDKYEDATLDWDDLDLLEGDLLAFEVVSATTIRKLTLALSVVPV